VTPTNRIRHASIAIVIGWLIVAPTAARAQFSYRINPSVRAAGMGDAGTAVFWGGDTNDWSNPALLGYQSGLQYRWSRTHFLPEISSDIFYDTNRVSYGWGGLGLGWSNLKFSLGESEGTDAAGNPTGTFESFERARPYGLGVSAARLLEGFALLGGGEAPAFTRYADVAFGYTHKSLRVELAPENVQGVATASANDYGVLTRVTPMPGTEDTPTLEFSYGYAALNYDDPSLAFPNEDQPVRVTREYRNGIAAHFAVPRDEDLRKSLARPFGHWIAQGMAPLLSVGVATDFVHFEQSGLGGSDAEQYGLEVEFLHVLSARVGHVNDSFDEIDGTTYGFGVGIPFGGFSGVRYDFGSTPGPGGTDALLRHAVMAWFDPVAFARR
jgi:hypothetical protein